MSVSLCMIVRDNAPGLAKCLHSVRGLFDEIVVVDTGSVDLTPEVARAAGANVCTFPWQDDFAAARNESLRRATGDWVMWLDSDEWLKPIDRHRLAIALANLKHRVAVWVMKQVSYGPATPEAASGPPEVVLHPRLWPRLPEAWWTGRVHEQILPALLDHGHHLLVSNLQIQHSGYQELATCAEKVYRNIRLAELETREHPERAEPWFFLGRSLVATDDLARAKAALREAIQRAGPADHWIGYAHQLLARIQEGGRHVEA